MRANIQLHHGDCMDALREMEDNEFELAIVDPPYGIGIDRWDLKPTADYFDMLMRVSKNQVIWGANYYHLPHSEAWLCWHKTAGFRKRAFGTQSDFELAWTSVNHKAKYLPLTCSGNICGMNGGRPDYNYKPIHPTQKPVALYKWLLSNYAKDGDRILDTHLGSGSIAIACWDMGFDLTGFELDADYYKAATERLARHKAQGQFEL